MYLLKNDVFKKNSCGVWKLSLIKKNALTGLIYMEFCSLRSFVNPILAQQVNCFINEMQEATHSWIHRALRQLLATEGCQIQIAWKSLLFLKIWMNYYALSFELIHILILYSSEYKYSLFLFSSISFYWTVLIVWFSLNLFQDNVFVSLQPDQEFSSTIRMHLSKFIFSFKILHSL